MNIESFKNISITGRYVYGYLCLRQLMNWQKLKELPLLLQDLLEEYTSSQRKDIWHQRIEELYPSVVLNINNKEEYYEYIPYNFIITLRQFYNMQSQGFLEVLEYLIDIGISNLYGGFDSTITLEPLSAILCTLEELNIPLPNYGTISECLVNQRDGWGNLEDVKKFLL